MSEVLCFMFVMDDMVIVLCCMFAVISDSVDVLYICGDVTQCCAVYLW